MTDPHAGLPVLTAGTPLQHAAAVVILLHGRGAGPENILDLVPQIARPGLSYLAPAAADRTWYPLSFLSPISDNEPKLSSALRRVGVLMADLEARGVPPNRIALLGFSQGACLAGDYVYRHPRPYGGLAMLSGGLIGPPGTVWTDDGAFAGMPVFLGCSDRDAHIPQARVEESARVFERMGASVTTRIYPGMGHLVNADEILQVQALLDRVSGSTV